MMSARKKVPDFFGDEQPDPVQVASGKKEQKSSGVEEKKKGMPEDSGKSVTAESKSRSLSEQKNTSKEVKKKVGYYLPVDMINQLDQKFYELKLNGVNIKKNDLVEAVFAFGLEDLAKGEKSRILKRVSK